MRLAWPGPRSYLEVDAEDLMTQTTRELTGPEPAPEKRPSFLEWFPWEKLTIWALFLLAVYFLRHFFFLIFMTFIVAYNLRAVVVRVSRLLSPSRERIWLERIVSVICFAGLLGICYGVGRYFVPELYQQGQVLIARVSKLIENPQEKFDEVLNDTVGRWLVREQLGGPGDERYTEAFEIYRAEEKPQIQFSRLQRELHAIEDGFKRRLRENLRKERLAQIDSEGARDQLLTQWILEGSRERLMAATRNSYEADRKPLIENPSDLIDPPPPFDELSEALQETLLRKHLNGKVLEDPAERAVYESSWKEELATKLLSDLEAEDHGEYLRQFREYYLAEREKRPADFPYEYEKYRQLLQAIDAEDGGEQLASILDTEQEVEEDLTEEEIEAQARESFEEERRAELVTEWKKGEIARKLGARVEEYVALGLSHFTRFIGGSIQGLLMLPVQLALSLMLSLFIAFDFHKIRRGVQRLKRSRISGFYEEIAPGLYSFGLLIGRAFQAQAVIAVFNTLLTFIAIQLLGIQNAAFLCGIVFLCSFIPVLGVVLSTVPIGLMAIIQDGGGILLAIWAIGAILLIHFIETSLLNPKILGDMLHLHPVLVLAILAIGEHFFGVWGLLLGVPVIVYIIRFVVLDEGIPGLIEPVRKRLPAAAGATIVQTRHTSALPVAEPGSEASDVNDEDRGVDAKRDIEDGDVVTETADGDSESS